MKKFFYIFFNLICILFFFVACKNKSTNNTVSTFKIISTIFPYYDFVKQIVKDTDNVEVDMLITPGLDSHSFEPTPQKVKDIKTAGLFIYNGGKNDSWIEKILVSLENKKDTCMDISDIFCDGGSKKEVFEEHFWTSILNCMRIVEKIKDKLCILNPKNSLQYERNAKKYLEDLKNIHEEFLYVVKNKKRDVLIFGDRFPFTYFIRDYGLKYISPYSGCSSKNSVSAFEVSNVIEKVKKNGVPVVLKLEQPGSDLAKVIADGSGAKIRTFYSCHGCSKEDFENGKTFLDFLKKNIETLKEALW